METAVRLALSAQLLARTHRLEEILDLLRSLGIDAVEIWPQNIPGDATPEPQAGYERTDVASARRILEASGMTAACVTLGGRAIQRCMVDGPGVGTDALKGAVDAAATLGARIVNCYLAGIAPAVFVQAVQPAAEYAGSLGITIVLENEAHDDSGTALGVRAIIEAVGSPHFATLYDPCNYYQANEEPYPYAYEVLKHHVRYVHLKGGCRYQPDLRPADHRGGTLRGHEDRFIGYVALPDSAVNSEGVLRRLARDGYTGFITLEPHVPVEQALAFYQIEVPYARQLLEQVQRPWPAPG